MPDAGPSQQYKEPQTTKKARNQIEDAQLLYNKRSAHYDNSWHPRFAGHFVELIKPRSGESVLDLACGTGLVTFEAAKSVGPDGAVVGIDISDGMLAKAQEKQAEGNITNVEFHRHSITGLATLAALASKQFDVITCASALVLLPKAAEALKQWMPFLKPGGRLIVDVPHPRSQLGFIALERVGNALDRPVPSYRVPFERGSEALEGMMEAAGLRNISMHLLSQMDHEEEDEDGFYDAEYLNEFICDKDRPLQGDVYYPEEADLMFSEMISTTYGASMAGDDVRSKAKEAFRLEWSALVSNGEICGIDGEDSIEEIDGVYVGIGFKEGGEENQDQESEEAMGDALFAPESTLGKRKAAEISEGSASER